MSSMEERTRIVAKHAVRFITGVQSINELSFMNAIECMVEHYMNRYHNKDVTVEIKYKEGDGKND